MVHRCDLVTEVIGATPAISEAILSIVTSVRSGDQETSSKVQSVIVHDSIFTLGIFNVFVKNIFESSYLFFSPREKDKLILYSLGAEKV